MRFGKWIMAASAPQLLAFCGGGSELLLGKYLTPDPAPAPSQPSNDPDLSPDQPSSNPEDEDPAATGAAVVRRDRIARQAAAAQRLFGGSPPVETAAEQDRRAREMWPLTHYRLRTRLRQEGTKS